MSMKSVTNKPHRDGFDLSNKRAFSAKLGELLPLVCEDFVPGDKFKIRADWFTRTQPVTSPAFTRFGEYYDFFFVPYHLLWRYSPQFFIQTDDDNWATSITGHSNKFTQHPYISSADLLSYIKRVSPTDSAAGTNDYNGFGVGYGAQKLLSYLGYGSYQTKVVKNTIVPVITSVKDVALNPFPLCAYQKIYQDFYRNSQWEKPAPFSYNLDYINNPNSLKVPLASLNSVNSYHNNLLSLRYVNANKDYFLGMLPQKQYGAEALASPLNSSTGDRVVSLFARNNTTGNQLPLLGLSYGKAEGYTLDVNQAVVGDKSVTYGIGALAIRQAEFLQKWKEITQSGGTDYVSQIQKHFGVKPNKDMAHRVTYIGGFSQKFGVDEVVNTNLSADTSEASIMGKGINGGHGELEFTSNEHGILMCVYHVGLLPEYTDSITDKFCLKTMPTDYVIPEMDNVGMQSVVTGEFLGFNRLTGQTTDPTAAIGYVPRYAEYKTKVDKVLGVFSNDLMNWVSPFDRNPVSIPSLTNDKFYKLGPHLLDTVFSVNADSTFSTDQFLVNCNFDIKAVRNISRDGLPY